MEEQKKPNIRINEIENPELDADKPTLVSFLIVEGFKWGGIVITIYVVLAFIFGFAESTVGRALSFLSWLFFGEKPAPGTEAPIQEIIRSWMWL